MDVVTADGQLRHIDEESEPELFWALRGGGGAYAVVTALEFGLLPLERAYAGALVWPLERAPDVLAAFGDWTADLSETVTSSVKLMRLPDLPLVPEPMRGQSLAIVTLAATDDVETAIELVAPLRQVNGIVADMVADVPPAAPSDIAADPQNPVPGVVGGHVLLSRFDHDVIAEVLALGGPGVEAPLLQLEIRHGGGALHRPGSGAASIVPGEMLVNGVGIAPVAEAAVAVRAYQQRMLEVLEPYAVPGTYLNFAEDRPSTWQSFPADVADRLVAVKRANDPDGLIVGCHAVD